MQLYRGIYAAEQRVLGDDIGPYRLRRQLGKNDYNMKLPKARAASVREYLKSRGIPESTLDSEGFGYIRPSYMPGVSDQTKLEAYRRVEFMVVK